MIHFKCQIRDHVVQFVIANFFIYLPKRILSTLGTWQNKFWTLANFWSDFQQPVKLAKTVNESWRWQDLTIHWQFHFSTSGRWKEAQDKPDRRCAWHWETVQAIHKGQHRGTSCDSTRINTRSIQTGSYNIRNDQGSARTLKTQCST